MTQLVHRKGPVAVDFSSILSVGDLEILRKTYLIPATYKMHVLNAFIRIYNELGPKHLLVYEEILKAGVRFPLSSFYLLDRAILYKIRVKVHFGPSCFAI